MATYECLLRLDDREENLIGSQNYVQAACLSIRNRAFSCSFAEATRFRVCPKSVMSWLS
jgi:hypothetical protein